MSSAVTTQGLSRTTHKDDLHVGSLWVQPTTPDKQVGSRLSIC